MPERIANNHLTKNCRNVNKLTQAMKALKEEKGHGEKKEAGGQGSGQQADKGSTQTAKSQSEGSTQPASLYGSQTMVPSTWVFGQVPSTYGPPMTQVNPAFTAPSFMPMQWTALGMKHVNVSQVITLNLPGMFVPGSDAAQMGMLQDSRQMQWNSYQPPAMTNSMVQQSNTGAPGPFQSGYSMFPNHLRASDQGYVMGGVNQSSHSDRPSGGESNTAHTAVLTHAERETRIKELVGYNSSGHQAMTGYVQTTCSGETPKDNDEMSEKESSKQMDLFAARESCRW